jgi:hypothetical protein
MIFEKNFSKTARRGCGSAGLVQGHGLVLRLIDIFNLIKSLLVFVIYNTFVAVINCGAGYSGGFFYINSIK